MPGLRDMLGGSPLDTFLGLPQGGPGADIVVFGADCATPYASVGAYCAGGPAAIRAGSADYAGALDRVNFDLMGPILPPGVTAVDGGDLAVDPANPTANRDAIRDMTAQILGQGGVPILLGGDDSLPIPMLQAYAAHGRLTILQIDAHIDWRDEVQGECWGLSSTMRRASEMAHVERIIQIGARGVGSAGLDALQAARDWGAHLIPAHDWPTRKAELAGLIPEGATVVVCFDCDALDPSIMPAVIAPTAGGLGYQDVMEALRIVTGRARLAGFDMVEFMPQADTGGIGARTGAQLLTSVIGLIGQQRAG